MGVEGPGSEPGGEGPRRLQPSSLFYPDAPPALRAQVLPPTSTSTPWELTVGFTPDFLLTLALRICFLFKKRWRPALTGVAHWVGGALQAERSPL